VIPEVEMPAMKPDWATRANNNATNREKARVVIPRDPWRCRPLRSSGRGHGWRASWSYRAVRRHPHAPGLWPASMASAAALVVRAGAGDWGWGRRPMSSRGSVEWRDHRPAAWADAATVGVTAPAAVRAGAHARTLRRMIGLTRLSPIGAQEVRVASGEGPRGMHANRLHPMFLPVKQRPVQRSGGLLFIWAGRWALRRNNRFRHLLSKACSAYGPSSEPRSIDRIRP
jgi:hypothetical protein